MTKVEFRVEYNHPLSGLGKKMVEVARCCDLGINDIVLPTKETWSWKTSEEVDIKYIAKAKNTIKEGIEKFGGGFISAKCLL